MSGVDLDGLADWQRAMLEAWAAVEPRGPTVWDQRGSAFGKTTVMLRVLRAEQEAGYHVHVAKREGMQCINGEADGCTLPAWDGAL